MATWLTGLMERGVSSPVELKLRLDNWMNAMTGLGTSWDKTRSTVPVWGEILSPMALETLYHNDDIATRIVTAIPEEAFREDWTLVPMSEEDTAAGENGNPKSGLEDDLKRLHVRRKMKEAWIWGRLYGKGAILVGANDGKDWSEPLDESAVRSVDFLTVLDRRDLTPRTWYADIKDERFGEIATYFVQPVGVYMGAPYEGRGTNPPIEVHESRLIVFGGELTGKRQRLANQGCDYSVLQKCYRALQLTNNNWQSASTLMSDFGQGVFKIRGLIDMIAQNPQIMNTRMTLMDTMRSTMRAIILDAGDGKNGPMEDFTRVATPVTGIDGMLVQTWNRLACAAKMPLMILMGSKPAGLNSDGEQDLEWWYNDIEGAQRDVVKPRIERMLMLCAVARGESKMWTVRFGPLRRMAPEKQADYDLKQAQRFKALVADAGVLTAEEVALSLAADPTGQRLQIEVPVRKAMLAGSFKAMKAEQEGRVKEAKAAGQPQDAGVDKSAKK